MPKAVITAGRLPKMAAHVVLVQNQPERAAAMRGKALIFSALLLALDISATSAQSLLDEKIKCQKLGQIIFDEQIQLESEYVTFRTNFDRKNQNCYVLIDKTPSNMSQKKLWRTSDLYDGATKEIIAFTFYGRDENWIERMTSWYVDGKNSISQNGLDAAEKYIADKMKTER